MSRKLLRIMVALSFGMSLAVFFGAVWVRVVAVPNYWHMSYLPGLGWNTILPTRNEDWSVTVSYNAGWLAVGGNLHTRRRKIAGWSCESTGSSAYLGNFTPSECVIAPHLWPFELAEYDQEFFVHRRTEFGGWVACRDKGNGPRFYDVENSPTDRDAALHDGGVVWSPTTCRTHLSWKLCLPWWLFIAIGGLPPLFLMYLWARRLHWRRAQSSANRCTSCGYDLYGNKSGVCPECGTKRPVGPHVG